MFLQAFKLQQIRRCSELSQEATTLRVEDFIESLSIFNAIDSYGMPAKVVSKVRSDQINSLRFLSPLRCSSIILLT